MFESLVKEKINLEKSKIRLLSPVSREAIRKSELSPFIKNFIFNETQEITESDYLDELIEKGVKLQFNFTIRPKWTLLNYVYGSIESKSDNEIRHKLKVFTFYKFYPDTILNYLDEERHLYVSKNKVELLLNDVCVILRFPPPDIETAPPKPPTVASGPLPVKIQLLIVKTQPGPPARIAPPP